VRNNLNRQLFDLLAQIEQGETSFKAADDSTEGYKSFRARFHHLKSLEKAGRIEFIELPEEVKLGHHSDKAVLVSLTDQGRRFLVAERERRGHKE